MKSYKFSFRIIPELCLDSRDILVFDELGRCHEENEFGRT